MDKMIDLPENIEERNKKIELLKTIYDSVIEFSDGKHSYIAICSGENRLEIHPDTRLPILHD